MSELQAPPPLPESDCQSLSPSPGSQSHSHSVERHVSLPPLFLGLCSLSIIPSHIAASRSLWPSPSFFLLKVLEWLRHPIHHTGHIVVLGFSMGQMSPVEWNLGIPAEVLENKSCPLTFRARKKIARIRSTIVTLVCFLVGSHTPTPPFTMKRNLYKMREAI